MRYLFYDVETASTSNAGSICAVGWVLADELTELQSGYTLIDPQCRFSPRCVEVHGITEADVSGAPTFADYWKLTLRYKLLGAVLVAHNAPFDARATVQALHDGGVDASGIDVLDFLPIARRCVDLDSHALPALAAEIGYEYQAHNALEDAKALLAVAREITRRQGCDSFTRLVLRGGPVQDALTAYPPKAPAQKKKKDDQPGADCVDDKLVGWVVVITGDLPGMTKEEVGEIIKRHGGKYRTGVTGKTTCLIVGDLPEDYAPGYKTGKHRQALELQEAGQDIKILHTGEALALLLSLGEAVTL